mgnify:CR=1 FL=1
MKKDILFVLLTVLLSSCFELDNYDAPNAGINGSLIDSETGEVVRSDPSLFLGESEWYISQYCFIWG